MTCRHLVRPLLRASRIPSTPYSRLSTASSAPAASTAASSAGAPTVPRGMPQRYTPKTPPIAKSPVSRAPFNKASAKKATVVKAPVDETSSQVSPPPVIPDPTATGPEAWWELDAQELSNLDVAAAQQLVTSRPGPGTPATEIDWSRSYHGLGQQPFPKEVAQILTQKIEPGDIEVKPDGIIYMPEIKYRRILNAAFGPGGWGLVPRGEVVVGERVVTREYALIAYGRFVSQAQGENSYFNLEGLPAAVEGCKSNALMRCCKDVGIASELWDPVFVRSYRQKHAEQVWVEHIPTKKKKQLWNKKGLPIAYPYTKA